MTWVFSGSFLCLLGMCGFVLVSSFNFVYLVLGEAGRPSPY